MAKVIDNGNGFYDFMFDNAKILEEAKIFIAVNADVSYEYLLKNFKSIYVIFTFGKFIFRVFYAIMSFSTEIH